MKKFTPRTRHRIISTLLAVFAVSCAGDGAPRQPAGWAASLAPAVTAEDTNPAPNIVEVDLVAMETVLSYRDGTTTTVWAYDGVVPGPTIEAEVGDRLIVNFTNDLPVETTIHWHGLELPALMDGTHLAQAPIGPGETFTYAFDLLTAATYWYHPHIQTNEQVERGLYGALVVRDSRGDRGLGLPVDEVLLTLDDVLVDENFEIAPPWPVDPVELARTQLNGREGDVLLVNGREEPRAEVRSGVPIRMRLINAANSRFFRVSADGHPFYRIGGDGGLLEAPLRLDPVVVTGNESDADPNHGVLLVPGERADIVFTPIGAPGTVIEIQNHDFHRGRHSVVQNQDGTFQIGHAFSDGDAPPVTIARLEIVAGSENARVYEPAGSLREIERIDITGASTLPVTFGHGMPMPDGNVTFFATMIDGVGIPFADLTAQQALQAEVGETYIYEVTNLTGGDHPFHPHGFTFQPIEIEYIDMDNPTNNRVETWDYVENKDSLRIPERPGLRGRSRTVARLAVRFDDAGREGQVEAYGKLQTTGRSGGWFVHCHILEHANRGMMTFLNLREPQ